MEKEKTQNTGNPFAQLKPNTFPDQTLNETQGNEKQSKTIFKIKTPHKNAYKNPTENMSEDDESSLFFANMSNVQKLPYSPNEKKNKQKKIKTADQCENKKNDGSKQDNDILLDQNEIQEIDEKDITNSKKILSFQDTYFITEEKIEKALNLKGDTLNTFVSFEVPNAFSQKIPSQHKTNITKTPFLTPLLNLESKKTAQETLELSTPSNIDIGDVNHESDLNLFFSEVSNVKSLHGKGRDIAPEPTPTQTSPPPVINPLQEFMDGKLEFALNFTDEYVEAHVIGLDLMTVGKLQARQYNPEAHIDLHGLNSEQAYNNLIAFFRNTYQRGLRTVLVVTGKGNNSVNGIPILRNNVQEWLTKDPFKRVILAFCSAKIEDGGSGALYVLIRKQKKNYGKIQWDTIPKDIDFL